MNNDEFNRNKWIGQFRKKSWRQLDELLANPTIYSQNHLNCYVDIHKTTSKVVCSYAYRSYALTNILPIENVSNELPGEGLGFIYSKNVAFKALSLYQKQGGNYIYMDNSYFSKYYDNKISKFRIIVNDIHPHINNDLVSPVQVELSPWNKRNDSKLFILICPPTGTILELFGVKSNWLEKTVEQIRSKTDRDILIRFKNYDFMNEEHERRFLKIAKRHHNIYYDKSITDANLLTLFEGCYAVVAPASGVGVIAASKGIPVFSEKIGPVASISLQDYTLINDPIYPDREQWINTILNHEFALSEIFSGEWLIRLKKIYPMGLKRILHDKINLL